MGGLDREMTEIFQCFFSNYEFKKQFGINYMKYPYLMVSKTKAKCKIWQIAIQILTSDEISLCAVSSPYFENF